MFGVAPHGAGTEIQNSASEKLCSTRSIEYICQVSLRVSGV